MNLVISAVALLLLGACDENDDVWSGGSGWLIGLGLAILIVSAIGYYRHRAKKP